MSKFTISNSELKDGAWTRASANAKLSSREAKVLDDVLPKRTDEIGFAGYAVDMRKIGKVFTGAGLLLTGIGADRTAALLQGEPIYQESAVNGVAPNQSIKDVFEEFGEAQSRPYRALLLGAAVCSFADTVEQFAQTFRVHTNNIAVEAGALRTYCVASAIKKSKQPKIQNVLDSNYSTPSRLALALSVLKRESGEDVVNFNFAAGRDPSVQTIIDIEAEANPLFRDGIQVAASAICMNLQTARGVPGVAFRENGTITSNFRTITRALQEVVG